MIKKLFGFLKKEYSTLNTIENSAKICKTIPYDILVHLAASTKRVIV